jgi:hypothetical protein
MTVSGLALTAAGLGALYRAWRAPQRQFRWIFAGWAALAAAPAIGSDTGISDRSVALSLLILPLLAYLLIVATADRRPGGRPAGANRPVAKPPVPTGPRRFPWRGLWRALLAGPLAALLGLTVAILVVRHGSGTDADRLVAAGLLAPTAWAAGMAWSLADGRLARVSLGLGTALLVTAAGALPMLAAAA